VILETRRGENENETDWLGAVVLNADPSAGRNEGHPSGVQIAFLIAQ
jgi:hypothetical protein